MKILVCVEMEAFNSDGSENDDLWETVTVEVDDLEENPEQKAIDKAVDMDFGERRSTGFAETKAL